MCDALQLEDLCSLFVDGDWIESKDQSDRGIRLIQTGNIGIGTFINKADKARYISEETFNRLKCCEVKPGDILISRLPDPIGRACVIPDSTGKMITAVDCSIVRLKNILFSDFFIAYTQSDQYLNQIIKYTTGTTRKRISRKNLGKITVPVPSLVQQKTIAKMFVVVNSLIQIEKALLAKLGLLVKSQFFIYFNPI